MRWALGLEGAGRGTCPLEWLCGGADHLGQCHPPPRWLWEPVRQCDNPLPILPRAVPRWQPVAIHPGSGLPHTTAHLVGQEQLLHLPHTRCAPAPWHGQHSTAGGRGRKSQDSRACSAAPLAIRSPVSQKSHVPMRSHKALSASEKGGSPWFFKQVGKVSKLRYQKIPKSMNEN